MMPAVVHPRRIASVPIGDSIYGFHAVMDPVEESTQRGKRRWTKAQDAFIREAFAEGLTYNLIAARLGIPRDQVCNRGYNLGLVRPDPADAMPRVNRWVCGPCGTKSDASLDFGCAKCWPFRSGAA